MKTINTILENNKLNKLLFLTVVLFFTTHPVLADVPTLDDKFNNPFVEMQVKQRLIPGMETESISFDTKELKIAEQAMQAGIEDSRNTLVGNLEESNLPNNTKAFLVKQAKGFDLFHWLGSKCVIDANVCGEQKFTLNIRTKSGGGFEGTDIKCDTSVDYREPKDRWFRSDVEGDIILTIEDCYFYAVPGNEYSKKSLRVMARSGYDGEPIKISMNEQVEFLAQVEAYRNAVNSTAVAKGVSGNAEVMGSFYNEALTTAPEAPSQAVQDALELGLIKTPTPKDTKVTAATAPQIKRPVAPKLEKPLKVLTRAPVRHIDLPKVTKREHIAPPEDVILARYCSVEKQGMTFECVLPTPKQEAGMDCQCPQTGGTFGSSRI